MSLYPTRIILFANVIDMSVANYFDFMIKAMLSAYEKANNDTCEIDDTASTR